MNSINETSENKQIMPILFVGHGSPMNVIQENEFVAGWRNVANTIPKPDAILCISAHWETKGTAVTAMSNPKTIHDFGGFPKALYEIQYPAKGSPDLALEIKQLITNINILLDTSWGLDHGCWSVVKPMFPNADIPVVQLSLDYSQDAQYHYNIAKQLLPLREKGVLIMGSGNLVHNLRMVAWDKINEPEFGYDWAFEANNLFKKLIIEQNHQQLIDYKLLGKSVNFAVPSPEHYLPLLYILALQQANESISFFNDKAVMGSLTMTSLKVV